MKKIILALTVTFVTSNAFCSTYAIYGKDDRKDIYESENGLLKNVARSTVAMIEDNNLEQMKDHYLISSKLFKDTYKLCPTEKFVNQLVAANCSGTLIDKDIVLTAGHCVSNGNMDCNKYRWVFDYKATSANQPTVKVPIESVYKCQEILYQIVDNKKNVDFALIKLDRKVLDRDPINMSSETNLSEGTKLALIGHPSGLPTKIADNGEVQKDKENYLVTNLDAFSVNSGSGVFNLLTGELEGVLVSGQMDFKEINNCTQNATYENQKGAEIVTKVKFVWEQIIHLSH